jgi:hypothetical protein
VPAPCGQDDPAAYDARVRELGDLLRSGAASDDVATTIQGLSDMKQNGVPLADRIEALNAMTAQLAG